MGPAWPQSPPDHCRSDPRPAPSSLTHARPPPASSGPGPSSGGRPGGSGTRDHVNPTRPSCPGLLLPNTVLKPSRCGRGGRGRADTAAARTDGRGADGHGRRTRTKAMDGMAATRRSPSAAKTPTCRRTLSGNSAGTAPRRSATNEALGSMVESALLGRTTVRHPAAGLRMLSSCSRGSRRPRASSRIVHLERSVWLLVSSFHAHRARRERDHAGLPPRGAVLPDPVRSYRRGRGSSVTVQGLGRVVGAG